MATIDFLPFAFDPAANVLDQADYLNVSVSTWRQLGFQTGTALSSHLNKVWRQASLIASMVAQFSADNTGSDMLDDGSTAGQSNLLATFTAAVKTVGSSGFTGNFLPLTGGTLTGPLVINAATALAINAPGGSDGAIALNALPGQATWIAGRSNNSFRWLVYLGDASLQGGSNQGADFVVQRHSDAGAVIDQPMTIARNTGVTNFTNVPTVAGGPMPFLPITGGILSGPVTIGGQGARYAIAPEGPQHYVGFGWNGSACELMVDGANRGLLATQGYVTTVVGAYLPLAGGTLTGPLTVNSNVAVVGTLQIGSTAFFGGVGDFAMWRGSGYRYRQWASNWYDYWSESSGLRGWATSGGVMTLDGGGNMVLPGYFRNGGGRIVTYASGFSPCIAIWNVSGGIAPGFWSDSSGLWFGLCDGSANPSQGMMRMQGNGIFEVWGPVYHYANLAVAGTITREGYLVIMSNNDQRCRYLGMYGGSLTWTDSDGSSWLANTYRSDPVFKNNIREADDFDSLGAIARLPIRAFDWKDARIGPHVPHGFVSTDLRTVGLDDVVRRYPYRDGEEADHVEILPVLAHLCRAVRQLNAKVERMQR